MKSALKALGVIVAFLLAAAALIAIVLYIMGLSNPNNGLDDAIDDAETIITATDAPQQNTDTNVITPAPAVPTAPPAAVTNPPVVITNAPISATTEPTAAPTPTPAPTPSPVPAGLPLGSGAFASDTGLWINTAATWSAETMNNTQAKVTVSVNLKHYALNSVSTAKALRITVGNQTASYDIPAINTDSDVEVVTELGTHDFVVDAPVGQTTTLTVKTEWLFGGTYSGEKLESIVCGGDIHLSR